MINDTELRQLLNEIVNGDTAHLPVDWLKRARKALEETEKTVEEAQGDENFGRCTHVFARSQNRCAHTALFRIGGHGSYCKKHAQERALP